MLWTEFRHDGADISSIRFAQLPRNPMTEDKGKTPGEAYPCLSSVADLLHPVIDIETLRVGIVSR